MGKKEKYNFSAFEDKSQQEEYDFSAFDVKKKDEVSSETSLTSDLPSDLPQEPDPVLESPVLKAAAEKTPWLAAPINALGALTRGTNKTFMPILDGAQRLFYKGVGSLMESSKNPDIQAAGSKLIVDQDTKKTWWKQAEEYVEKVTEEKMPAPIREDAASRLVYDLFELAPFLATLTVTPNPAIAGVGLKLPLNFFAQNTLKTYSEVGKPGPSLKEGIKSVPEAMAIQMLGLAGSKVGTAAAKVAAKTLSSKIAGATGASAAAGTMGAGGYAHSVASQLVNKGEVDWEEAEASAVMWTAFGVPGMMQAAVSTYKQAPKEAIEFARQMDAEVKALRKAANELVESVAKEADPNKKAETLTSASMMNKVADLRAMDQFFGKNAEESIKRVKESDISESEKLSLINKIEDSALQAEYQKQLDLTKDLATAGDKLKEEVKPKPKEDAVQISKPKEGDVRQEPEGGKGLRPPQKEVKEERQPSQEKERVLAEEAKKPAVAVEKAEPPKKPPKPPKPVMEEAGDVPPEKPSEPTGVTEKNIEAKIDQSTKERTREVKKERRVAKQTFREKVFNRRVALNLGAYNTNLKVNHINKLLTPSEREAVSLLIEKQGIPKDLEGTKVAEAYNNPTQRMKAVERVAKKHFDETWADIVANTENMTVDQVKDYVTHIWDIPKNQINDVANWFSTKNRFLNKRYIPSLKEGMDKFGLKPKTLDIGEVIITHAAAARMSIENKKFLVDLKTLDIGGVPAMGKPGKVPPGYIEYKHPAFKYKQWLGKGKDGKPILGDRYYRIHPDMEPYFDAIFTDARFNAKGIEKFAQGFENVNNYIKKAQLSASLFHHGALSETAMANMGLPKMLRVLVKDVMWDATKFGAGTSPAFKDPALARRAIKHGVTVGATQDILISKIQNDLNNLAKFTEKVPGINLATKGWSKFNATWDKALWEYLHDGFKIHGFEHLASKVDAAKMSPEAYTKKLNELGSLINDTYGGQNWDVMLVSPQSQRLMRFALLSPDWTVSTFKQFLAPTGLGNMYKNSKFWSLSKENPINARRRAGAAFWLRGMFYYGTLTNLANAVNRMNDIEENPNLYTPEQLKKLKDFRLTDVTAPDYLDKLLDFTMYGNTIGHNTHMFMGRYEDGSEYYVRPGKQFREGPELLFDDGGFSVPGPMLKKLGGKFSPAGQLILQAFTRHSGSGYENYSMRDKEGWDFTGALMLTLAKSITPFMSANLMRGDKEWQPLDLLMPSSKGMTPSAAEDYFFKGIAAQDPQFVAEIYEGAVNNKLDAFSLFSSALRRYDITTKQELKSTSNDISELKKEIKKEENPNKRDLMNDRLDALYEKEERIKESRDQHQEAMDVLDDYLKEYQDKWGETKNE